MNPIKVQAEQLGGDSFDAATCGPYRLVRGLLQCIDFSQFLSLCPLIQFCKDHGDKIELPDPLGVEDLISYKLNQ